VLQLGEKLKSIFRPVGTIDTKISIILAPLQVHWCFIFPHAEAWGYMLEPLCGNNYSHPLGENYNLHKLLIIRWLISCFDFNCLLRASFAF